MRRAWTMLGAVAAIGLASWGIYAWTGDKAAAKPAVSTPPVPVTAATAEARDVPITVNGIGSVQAYNNVAIKTRIDGQIVKVDFTEGQDVKAGDPLFEIDPHPYQAALAQAQANREKDAALLVSAQADLARVSTLAKSGYQSRQTYDQQKAQVGQLQGAIAGDDAAIQAAQVNLDYATIRAPIDGRLGARQVDIGNIVHSADDNSLVTITQLHPIFVSFTVPQQNLDAIRAGAAQGGVAVQAISQSTQQPIAQGTLTLIDNQVDQTTGTIHLKATFANDKTELWPGAFVSVRLVTGTAKGAVTVPARVVQQGPSGPYLFVIKPDNTVEQRTVAVGQGDDTTVVVTKGLAAGETVVLDGQYRLDPNSHVAVQDPSQGGQQPDGQAVPQQQTPSQG